MKRRQFIILSGIGATSASLLSACGHPEEKLIPAFIPDEDFVPGLDYWKASTCEMCPAGCGIVVRTREHKANKIEGNPLHPVNRGALCARGQAGLEVLYNPDRIKAPMKRVGERGEGKWEEITWDEAIKTLADRIQGMLVTDQAGSKDWAKLCFVTNNPQGVTGLAAESLSGLVKSMILVRSDVSASEARSAYEAVYAAPGEPVFDIANASYLLSFGARFLENWQSPVMYSLAYGEFRRSANRRRGRFVQVEPRMSLTGANADEWLPAAKMNLVALTIMQVMTREGLVKNASPPDFLFDPLNSYAPEMIGDEIGIPAEKLVAIAREFAAADRPLAIGHYGADLRTINHLNVMVGNLNKPGGVLLNEGAKPDPFATMRATAGKSPLWELRSLSETIGAFEMLLLHQVNPVHTHPATVEKLKAVPFIASLSSFLDETAQLSDMILPDHSYLERWDIGAVQLGTKGVAVNLTRPIINPELNTKQTADVLLALVEALGGVAPIKSAEEVVKQSIAALPRTGGSISAESPEEFFITLSERGVWSGEWSGVQDKSPNPNLPKVRHVLSEPADPEYPFSLILFEHSAIGFGEQANLPSLQELPDPMTSVIWGSWVEINPNTADSLGISDGDLVEVSTEHGSVRVPAIAYPAIRPDVIAMPYGQGHAAYGRYGATRGVNPALLNPGHSETVHAKVARVGDKSNLIRFGTDLQERMEKRR
ncbi:MAG: molybdopterin-dependent oxidoreductase [Blastocatellia bacterium]